MTEEAGKLPPPLPPRLDWFVHTQVGQVAQDGIPEWFHGTISREEAENLLESQPLGTFLIRVSHSHVGYTLSYKAQSACRHFMVKLLDDGSFLIPGENVAHASLDALVTFHQRKPIRPHDQLLTQPCGQKDPAKVDYEDLFLYSHALAEDNDHDGPACSPRQRRSPSACVPEEDNPNPAAPCQSEERRPPAGVGREPAEEAFPSCPHKVPFGEAGQKLWRTLKGLPQASRRLPQQLKSHLMTGNWPSPSDAGRSTVTGRPRTGADSREHSGDTAWKDSVSKDPCVTTSLTNPSQPQARRNRAASSRKTTRPTSWNGVATGVRSWHKMVMRSLSSQASKPESGDLAEPQRDWLPEEYRPPPPFNPGYC